jgi:hypothetical protein
MRCKNYSAGRLQLCIASGFVAFMAHVRLFTALRAGPECPGISPFRILKPLGEPGVDRLEELKRCSPLALFPSQLRERRSGGEFGKLGALKPTLAHRRMSACGHAWETIGSFAFQRREIGLQSFPLHSHTCV